MISIKQLLKHCRRTEKSYIGYALSRFRNATVAWHGVPYFSIYIDNGADILAVSHLDTALSSRVAHSSKIRAEKVHDTIIVSPSLDDRLGTYLILDVLPHQGLNYDILLTTGEEIGRSTAQFFHTKKDYNWIFSLDRRGLDCVLYDYEASEAATDAVNDSDIEVGFGSFSDIAYLDHLGACGFNFGCGYHNEHTSHCMAYLSDIKTAVAQVRRFYNANRNTRFEYSSEMYNEWLDARWSAWRKEDDLWGRDDSTQWWQKDDADDPVVASYHQEAAYPCEQCVFCRDDLKTGVFYTKTGYGLLCHRCASDGDTWLEECAWCGIEIPFRQQYELYGCVVCRECANYKDDLDAYYEEYRKSKEAD